MTSGVSGRLGTGPTLCNSHQQTPVLYVSVIAPVPIRAGGQAGGHEGLRDLRSARKEETLREIKPPQHCRARSTRELRSGPRPGLTGNGRAVLRVYINSAGL